MYQRLEETLTPPMKQLDKVETIASEQKID